MNFTQKSLLTIIGKFSTTFLSLISSIFLARYLGVSGIGQYQLLVSTQVIIVTIMAMGFGNAIVYFINSKKISQPLIVTSLLKFFLIIAIGLTICMIVFLKYLAGYFGELSIYTIILFSIGCSNLLMYNILMPALYTSFEVIKLQALGAITILFSLVGIIIFIQFNFFDINIALSLLGVGNTLATSLLLFFLRKNIHFNIKIDFLLLKELFYYGIKLSVTNLVFLLSANIVIFLLKIFIENGYESVGLFSRATAIANMFTMIPASLGPLLYSKWAIADKRILHHEVEKTLRILLFISISCVIGIFIYGEELLNLLYGKEFLPAKYVLNLLSVSLIFSSITIVFTNLFSGIGKPLVTLKIYMGSLIITSFTSFLMIPIYNINGAAIAVLLGLIYNAVSLFLYSKKEIGIHLYNSIVIQKEDFYWIKDSLSNKFIKNSQSRTQN